MSEYPQSETAMLLRIQEIEGLLRETRPHIGDEGQRSWPDDPEFDDMLQRVDAALSAEPPQEKEEKPWPRYPLFDSSKPPVELEEEGD